jgi:hypothetical protein
MSAQATAQTVAKPTFIPVASGLLQRACACGQHTASSGGECEECRQKREGRLPHRAVNLIPAQVLPSTPNRTSGNPGFAHDFSRRPTHTHDDKRESSVEGPGNQPRAILTQLGSGRPFEGSARSGMEAVFGQDFSHVRVHTDTRADELSRRFNAQAFAVGNHIAFASGQYHPGTLLGDALIAHELAHVSQQGEADSSAVVMQMGGTEYNALERDADTSATRAVVSLWGRTKAFAAEASQKAVPRLRSGLRLSLAGCSGGKSEPKVEEKAPEAGKKALTCTEICDQAYKDPSLNHGGGGVICNGNQKCACVFDVSPITRGECPDFDAIVLHHEQRHLTDVDCDPSKGLHRPPFKDPTKAIASECAHRTVSIAEMDTAIAKATEPCKGKMTTIRGELDTWVKANCGGP